VVVWLRLSALGSSLKAERHSTRRPALFANSQSDCQKAVATQALPDVLDPAKNPIFLPN
jgi:hypothetical protein